MNINLYQSKPDRRGDYVTLVLNVEKFVTKLCWASIGFAVLSMIYRDTCGNHAASLFEGIVTLFALVFAMPWLLAHWKH